MPRVPLPPGGHRARGGDARRRCTRAASGSASAPARRSTSTSSAAYWPEIGDPQRDDVRGDRDHQQAVHRQGRQAQGRVLHARERHASTRCPTTPVPIYVATAGRSTPRRPASSRDGMITVGAADEKIEMLWEKCDEGAREAGKDPTTMPKLLQIHVSWARTDEEALAQRGDRVAERRHALPEAGHQEPRGLRGDGQAGPAGGLQEPGPDDQPTSTRTRRTSSTTWTWASTRSTSTTSAATRPSSSRCSASEVLPQLELG